MRVTDGVSVQMTFVAFGQEGEVLDDQWRERTFQFTLGQGEMPEWFESRLTSYQEGDEFEFTVPMQEAYGERNKQLVQKVKQENLPEGLKEGMVIQMEVPGMEGLVPPLVFHVKRLKEGMVHMDGNHPMAGHDITVKGRLVRVIQGAVGGVCPPANKWSR